MIFGLFKKQEYADIVYKGGRIYTLDADAPWAEAVACKDGRIMAVGDDRLMSELTGEDTEVVDLEGGTLLPGFIDICGHPVLQAFQKVCLILYEDMPRDMVLSALAEYVNDNPGYSGYFAYGFNTDYVAGKKEEELWKALDEICNHKPIAMLDISGLNGWFNTKAMELVRAAIAEETEPKIITIAYVLHVLSPIDFESLQRSVVELAGEYCKRGYTTVFDCGSPDFLHAIYQEMIVEMLQTDMLKQRLKGSFLITNNISPEYVVKKMAQKSDSCGEISEYIDCCFLKLIAHSDTNENAAAMNDDLLKILAIMASDKGFDFHIDAIGEKAVTSAFNAAFTARAAGYKKSTFIIAHSQNLNQEEKTELLLDNDLHETFSTLGDFNQKYRSTEYAKNVKDAIDKLTLDAAVLLGISDDYGSVESGKRADFVVYDENLLDCNLPRFRGLDSRMTIIDGEIVYDAARDIPSIWHTKLKERVQEMQEQMALDDEEEYY